MNRKRVFQIVLLSAMVTAMVAATVASVAVFTSCKVSYTLSGASISPLAKTVSIAYIPNNAPMVAPILSSTLHDALQDKFMRQTGLNIEQIVYKFAPETVITRHTTWDNLLNSSASGTILATFIVFIFTIAAIVIVITGIVNTILFTITKRTREIAIHIAMGATIGRVFWLVTSDVVKAGIVGLLLGSLASWWVVKASAHFFYNGAQHHGLLELIFIAVLMLLIIVIASLIPALRILRIEISRALAAE